MEGAAPSLLIIFRYDYGHLRIANLEQSRRRILEVLEKYRAVKGDVIHVVHAGSPLSPVMTGGTELEKEFPELTPIEGEKVCEALQLFDHTRIF